MFIRKQTEGRMMWDLEIKFSVFFTHWHSDNRKFLMRNHLLSRDFGLQCHSLSEPGHRARQRHCHPDPHAVGALPLVHHRHVQRPANTQGTNINWLFPKHSCTRPFQDRRRFCFLVFFLSNFSFLLSDLSGFDSLCIAGHRKGSNFWMRRLILAQERCFLGPAVHVLVASYLVWGTGIGSEMQRKGSKVLLCFWQCGQVREDL